MIIVSWTQFHVYILWCQCPYKFLNSVLNVKVLVAVGTFNQEKGPSPWLWNRWIVLQHYILPDMHKTYTYNTTLTGIAAACSNKWHNVVAFNFYSSVKVTYLQNIIQSVWQNIIRVSSESRRIVDTFCFSSQEQTECIHTFWRTPSI